ncbi:MAG: hypothetical protein QOI35_1335, partial [Cryptosporangiaceae bacterium]|nr:hypothetical protein [Cryptosporangiaceae bacterium]
FPAWTGVYTLQGGASIRLNHHYRHSEQRWALDLVPVSGPLGRNRLPATRVAVLAPVSGRVMTAVDGLPDAPEPGEAVPRYGNHVVLECTSDGNPVHLYLCHLAQGSVHVSPGDRVTPGQLLGEVGNSGRSTEPHLHVHAIRRGAGPEPAPLTLAGRQLWRGRTARSARR